jgi:hypothetical protein
VTVRSDEDGADGGDFPEDRYVPRLASSVGCVLRGDVVHPLLPRGQGVRDRQGTEVDQKWPSRSQHREHVGGATVDGQSEVGHAPAEQGVAVAQGVAQAEPAQVTTEL